MKPVVAIPLWIAVPAYVMYAVVWIALVTLGLAIAAAAVVGYGVVAVIQRSRR